MRGFGGAGFRKFIVEFGEISSVTAEVVVLVMKMRKANVITVRRFITFTIGHDSWYVDWHHLGGKVKRLEEERQHLC